MPISSKTPCPQRGPWNKARKAGVAGLLATCLYTPALAAPLAGQFTGGAASIAVSAGGAGIDLQASNSAHVGCPCRGTHGKTRERTTSAIALGTGGDILSATTTGATSEAGKSAGAAETMQTATISNLSLLGGLITADSLKAAASVAATPDKLTTSDAGTTLVHLVIGGQAIDPNVPDNTVIALPGVGSVTVKATDAHAGKQAAHSGVEVLRVDVTHANSLLPVGARLVIAKAEAGYKRAQPAAALGGSATGIRVRGDAGNPLDEAAGAGSSVGLPGCDGTGGVTKTKSVTDISLPGFLSLGTETETAFGGPVGAAQVVKTSSTLANVSLLAGLITADSVAAVAQESRTGDTSTPSAAGSGVNNLKIAGVPIAITTQPNRQVTLPGLGYVVVNEQTAHGKSALVVNGLHVVVTSGNLLGVPVGATILLGHADAVAARF